MVGSFRLQRSHEICFTPQVNMVPAEGGEATEDKGALINRVGALVPKQCWNTHCTGVRWSTKWGSAGLTPVRPVVVFLSEVEVPANKALCL
jgi:hypothetical protein